MRHRQAGGLDFLLRQDARGARSQGIVALPLRRKDVEVPRRDRRTRRWTVAGGRNVRPSGCDKVLRRRRSAVGRTVRRRGGKRWRARRLHDVHGVVLRGRLAPEVHVLWCTAAVDDTVRHDLFEHEYLLLIGRNLPALLAFSPTKFRLDSDSVWTVCTLQSSSQ